MQIARMGDFVMAEVIVVVSHNIQAIFARAVIWARAIMGSLQTANVCITTQTRIKMALRSYEAHICVVLFLFYCCYIVVAALC